LAGDLTETPAIDRGVRSAELRVVQGIKRFQAELRARSLTHLVEADFLEKGKSTRAGAGHAHVGKFSRGVTNRVVSRKHRDVRGFGGRALV